MVIASRDYWKRQAFSSCRRLKGPLKGGLNEPYFGDGIGIVIHIHGHIHVHMRTGRMFLLLDSTGSSPLSLLRKIVAILFAPALRVPSHL